MHSNFFAYLHSWSAELLSRASRVRQLIGDSHWLSDGHHKEELLREFLGKYLPDDLTVSRGFVKNASNLEICSTEVDILVSDKKICPPFFHEGGLQIVDATSVVAHLEVKTAFSRQVLKNAVLSTCKITRIVEMRRAAGSVWSAVVFYHGLQDAVSVLNTLEAVLREISEEEKAEGREECFSYPNAITIMDRFVIFVSQPTRGELDCRLFEIEMLSLASVIVDMFGHIRHVGGGAAISGFDDALEGLPIAAPIRRSIKL